MRLNEHALEITGKPEEYSEWFYWISIFGHPSPDEPWGWQIDGHHLNVNCFVLGDQMVMTPGLHGLGAGARTLRQICRHARVRRGGRAGPCTDARAVADERRRATVGNGSARRNC